MYASISPEHAKAAITRLASESYQVLAAEARSLKAPTTVVVLAVPITRLHL